MQEAHAARDGASAAAHVRPPLKVGVWVDDAFPQIDSRYLERLKACGITEVALMTNRMNATSSAPPFELRSPEETIVRVAQMFRLAGFEVVLTCWPRPSRGQIVALHGSMRDLMRDSGAVALEVDAEANWTPRFLDGFATMEHAAAHLVDCLRDAARGRRVEMTTFAQHGENARGADLAPLVDCVFPQAYSVTERGGKVIPWDHPYGPGRMQTLTHERAVQSGARSVGFGLAAYEQRFAGHDPRVAMRVALERSRELGVDHVRYWSSKWIVGARGTSWARAAITEATRTAL